MNAGTAEKRGEVAKNIFIQGTTSRVCKHGLHYYHRLRLLEVQSAPIFSFDYNVGV